MFFTSFLNTQIVPKMSLGGGYAKQCSQLKKISNLYNYVDYIYL